ncbi:MAG: hypothetical protein M3044_03535 [Thermoproteota archaeon]|nr:hypothetical protein [Thermoproteota archaeon]
MDHIPISISGEGSIPRPFNANDVTIWTDLICKFMCHNINTHFDIGNFLQEVIEDKIMPLNAYDKEMLKKAAHGDKNEFYNIVVYCQESLQRNQLLTSDSCLPTERLKAICPIINQILMPGVKSVLNAEREIRNDPNYSNIVSLLKNLKGERIVQRDDVTELITPAGLSKLTQLGIIVLYLDGRVKITPLGR